jgi:hypothetical protein
VVIRATSLIAGVGALSSTVAMLGCCGLVILGPAGLLGITGSVLTPLGSAWGYEAMYVSLALTLAGTGMSAWRHWRPEPLILAGAGALALLLAFHEAWDVGVFAFLVWMGLGTITAAIGYDFWLRRGACSPAAGGGRSCVM